MVSSDFGAAEESSTTTPSLLVAQRICAWTFSRTSVVPFHVATLLTPQRKRSSVLSILDAATTDTHAIPLDPRLPTYSSSILTPWLESTATILPPLLAVAISNVSTSWSRPRISLR